jgi:uncharacterized protein (DUF2141 family)
MEPANNSVNVTADRIRIEFSEWVNEASFASAFNMTPELEEPLEFDWGRRSVEIKFRSELRENTTYILNIGTGFRDANGVSLRDPITRAFSTGPEINRGKLAGHVVESKGGAPVPGMKVFAYLYSDSVLQRLPDRPAYQTETGSEGRFVFDYLEPTDYFVVAVEDMNANRRADETERFAPPPNPMLRADTTWTRALPPWIATRVDTTRPEIRRVSGLSDRRLRVTFSENIRFVRRDRSLWTVADSTSGSAVRVLNVYKDLAEDRQVFLLTEAMAARPYRLTVEGVADSSGNPALEGPFYFRPGSAPDTTRTRFVDFIPRVQIDTALVPVRLLPREHPGVRLSSPPDSTVGLGFVSVTDTTGGPVQFTSDSPDGVNLLLHLEPPLVGGDMIDVSIAPSPGEVTDSTRTQRFEKMPDSEFGGFEGVVASGGAVVDAYGAPLGAEPLRAVADSSGRFSFFQLPAGLYGLRIFDDENRNGSWDGGLLSPYSRRERIAWIPDTIRVRPRWDTVIADTLKLDRNSPSDYSLPDTR